MAIKLYYDFHIHSALSPCGDEDMTPNNIVNMAVIKGLDMIAIADHNSAGNCEAVMKAAPDGLLVLPAIEVETAEEVHMLCMFEDLDGALSMEREIIASAPPVENRSEIFGRQLYMDENDEVTGEENRLLVTASGLDIYKVVHLAGSFGGVAIPAHIDRSSYSVLSNLGFVPPDLDVSAVEITGKNLNVMRDDYEKYNIITNSDAHYLENISERYNYIDLPCKNAQEVIKYLCKSTKKYR